MIKRAWIRIECTWWLRIIFASFAGMILGIGGVYGYLWHLDSLRAPVNIFKVETLSSPIKEGSILIIRVWRKKFRSDCPVQSQRYVTNEDGRAFDVPDLTWRGGEVLEDFVDLPIDTRGIPAGEYTTHITGVYLCLGRTFVTQVPTVKFRVLPK